MALRELAGAVENSLPMAERLLDDIEEKTRDDVGVTRQGYGEGEQAAYTALAEAARSLDLEVETDAAGNLHMTLPGRDRRAKRVVIGSHMDSVPHGGNYDGLAGIVSGLSTVTALREAGITPAQDVTVMGIRCEESPWYGIPFVGSRLALGRLPASELDDLKRFDTGQSLAAHMAELGLDPDALRGECEPRLGVDSVRAYLELHIEQGPLLISRGIPVGIATGIRGNVRWPEARCLGRYDHSGAVPRIHRKDTVLAVVELIGALERIWVERDEADPDEGVVLTFGRFTTHPELSTMTKVPGEVDFTINFGSTSQATMDEFRDHVYRLADDIAARRQVQFDLRREVGANPTVMESELRRRAAEAAAGLGIEAIDMATVGHDASSFINAGVPAAVILIRNAEGSHNPNEEMEMADFGLGTQVVAAMVAGMT